MTNPDRATVTTREHLTPYAHAPRSHPGHCVMNIARTWSFDDDMQACLMTILADASDDRIEHVQDLVAAQAGFDDWYDAGPRS